MTFLKNPLMRRWIHLIYLIPIGYVLWLPLLKPLDYAMYNLAHARRAAPTWDRVAVVEIDERTKEQLLANPVFPLSRHQKQHAQLIKQLAAAGVEAVVLDFHLNEELFDSPTDELEASMREAGNVYLIASVRKGRDAFSEEMKPIMPAAAIVEAAKGVFAPNIIQDNDGVWRRVGELPHLKAMGLSEMGVPFGGVRITGEIPIEYPSVERPMPTVSYADVIAGTDASLASLAGRVVFVGSALDDSQDYHRVPRRQRDNSGNLTSTITGVAVLASITETLLKGAPLRDVPAWITLLWITGWALLLVRSMPEAHPKIAFVTMLLVLIVVGVASSLLHIRHGYVVPAGLVLGCLSLVGVYTTVQSHLRTWRRTLDLREEQLRLVIAQQAAVLNNAAKNVSHLINNAISPAKSSSQLAGSVIKKMEGTARDDTGPELADRLATLRELNERILDSAQDVEGIVRSYKSVTGIDLPAVRNADINNGLLGTWKLLEHKRAGISAIHEEYGNIPLVRCRASLLFQAFMNILENAIRAVREGGEITVRTAMGDRDTVVVDIEDTGVGIPPDALPFVRIEIPVSWKNEKGRES
jgi:CHASE2 domain-containing sensor protein